MLEFASLDRAAFADVVDETQLSLELYFHARELNRAQHARRARPPAARHGPAPAGRRARPGDIRCRTSAVWFLARIGSICLRRAIGLNRS